MTYTIPTVSNNKSPRLEVSSVTLKVEKISETIYQIAGTHGGFVLFYFQNNFEAKDKQAQYIAKILKTLGIEDFTFCPKSDIDIISLIPTREHIIEELNKTQPFTFII